jgi:hypothetical protein
MAEFSAGDELKRNTVHAITEASWLGPIVENVSGVASAAVTMNLGADQEKETAVLRCSDCPIDTSSTASAEALTAYLQAVDAPRAKATPGARKSQAIRNKCIRAAATSASAGASALGTVRVDGDRRAGRSA